MENIEVVDRVEARSPSSSYPILDPVGDNIGVTVDGETEETGDSVIEVLLVPAVGVDWESR